MEIFVKRVTACILFILLGQAISIPTLARAGTSFAQRKPHANSMEKYMKHQRKEQKKAHKSQKRAERNWKMRHHTGH
jgi:Sec-independent protein translocase protein TatA